VGARQGDCDTVRGLRPSGLTRGRRTAPPPPLHYERHRPEQTTLYRPVQQHAASFIAHTLRVSTKWCVGFALIA
jgi:hypothetical protein